ncbi:MAG: SDR family oxidoreductase [Chlorobium sp.]
MSKYDLIKIGDTAELSHTITQHDIDHFVELTGDDNRLHVDVDYAETTVFKKPVVHGMLGASFISTVIGTKLPGDGALWFAQNLEFLLPVRIGDTITVLAEVLRKYDRDKIVELKTDIINQHKQTVTTGVAKVKIIEQQLSSESPSGSENKKIALVIGATGGIGQAVCKQLANDGFDIAIHYHQNKQAALKIQASVMHLGISSMTCSADIVDTQQASSMVEQVLRKFGGLTLLVNCATPKIPIINFSSLLWEDIQVHIDMNIRGMLNLAKKIVPIFEAQKSGKIIAFTSQAIETPSVGWLHYITAKAALQGFSRALAVELAPKGITVNMISPGMTETELISDIPEKNRLMVAAKAPLRRLAKPEDIAGTVSFLASSRADYITGETIRVNGGQVML